MTIKAAELELARLQWGELFEEGLLFLTADKLTRSGLGESLRDPDEPLAKSVYAAKFDRLCRIISMGARVFMKYIKGDKREQRRLEKLIAKIAKAPHVAIGILQDEKYDDGFSMVDLAIVHEYGSKAGRIPERSFIRSTCDQERNKHATLMSRRECRKI